MHIVEWILFVWLVLASVSMWMVIGTVIVYFIDENHLDESTLGEVALLYLIWPVIYAICVIELHSQRKEKKSGIQ